ncbi:hypothetical protein [Parachitinimonas caeni]|uniref:Uncharacterized protein n=1 Tax=Parachitinimonas caeni TaxID=3031301 RepID=A0ABT7E369_9NEIS|nr:hypothetical protein [Parachitinimonas caeni]MDK2126771.1 hypothetical protein [Parachitinimonas caeni]
MTNDFDAAIRLLEKFVYSREDNHEFLNIKELNSFKWSNDKPGSQDCEVDFKEVLTGVDEVLGLVLTDELNRSDSHRLDPEKETLAEQERFFDDPGFRSMVVILGAMYLLRFDTIEAKGVPRWFPV